MTSIVIYQLMMLTVLFLPPIPYIQLPASHRCLNDSQTLKLIIFKIELIIFSPY